MLFSSLVSLIPAFSSSLPTTESSSKSILKHPNDVNYDPPVHAHAWPSVHESAVAARRILKLHGISTLSSVFPSGSSVQNQPDSSSHTSDELAPYADRPASVAGAPVGLMDYHASCGTQPYDPLLIGVTIATTMRNAAAGSNVTLSMRYHMPEPASPPSPPADDPWAYLPANLPRFSLIGYLERISRKDAEREGLDECFFKVHPDARLWAPGGEIEPHESWWARLKVREIYFFGGFGDRARIGWIPLSEWQGVTKKEVDAYRLTGEEGWRDQKPLRTVPELVIEEEWEDPLVAANEL